MLFFWMYSLASLVLLLIAKIFFVVSADLGTLLLWLFVIFLLPLCIPLVSLIRRDVSIPRSPWSVASVISILIAIIMLLVAYFVLHWGVSTIVFFAVLFVASSYAIDSRIFFWFALWGLVFTIVSLLLGLNSYAEISSIYVYIALVLGVLVELLSPYFAYIHRDSTTLVQIPEGFIQAYRRDMEQYTRMILVALGVLFISMVIGYGRWWHVDVQLYIYLSLIILLFFVVFLFLVRTPYTLTKFFHGDSGLSVHLPRFITRQRFLWIDAAVATICASVGLIYGLGMQNIIILTLIVTAIVWLCTYLVLFSLKYVRS